MKIIDAGYEIINPYLDEAGAWDVYRLIELAGRTCYKSEDLITDESAERFVRAMVKNGHEAMLEHANMTVRFTVDRGVSHELVRHRLASFAQESTRYVGYDKAKFGGEITFIRPCFLKDAGPAATDIWVEAMAESEKAYMNMIKAGCPPEQARSVLPNSVKTEVVMTMNMREMRHFLKLRAAGVTGRPHPQMLEVAVPLLIELKEKLPALFYDIEPMKI